MLVFGPIKTLFPIVSPHCPFKDVLLFIYTLSPMLTFSGTPMITPWAIMRLFPLCFKVKEYR